MPSQFPHPYSSISDHDPSKVRNAEAAGSDTMPVTAQIILDDLPAAARRERDAEEAIREAAPHLYAALNALAVGLELHMTLIGEALHLVKDAVACAQPKGTV